MSTFSKNVKERISSQIERFKTQYHYKNYVETITGFLENEHVKKHYDYVTHANIGDFLTQSLKEKIFIDASDLNFIKKDQESKSNDLIF